MPGPHTPPQHSMELHQVIQCSTVESEEDEQTDGKRTPIELPRLRVQRFSVGIWCASARHTFLPNPSRVQRYTWTFFSVEGVSVPPSTHPIWGHLSLRASCLMLLADFLETFFGSPDFCAVPLFVKNFSLRPLIQSYGIQTTSPRPSPDHRTTTTTPPATSPPLSHNHTGTPTTPPTCTVHVPPLHHTNTHHPVWVDLHRALGGVSAVACTGLRMGLFVCLLQHVDHYSFRPHPVIFTMQDLSTLRFEICLRVLIILKIILQPGE